MIQGKLNFQALLKKVVFIFAYLHILLAQDKTINVDTQTAFANAMTALNADANKATYTKLIISGTNAQDTTDKIIDLTPIQTINTMPQLTELRILFKGTTLSNLTPLKSALSTLTNLLIFELDLDGNIINSLESFKDAFTQGADYKLTQLILNFKNNAIQNVAFVNETVIPLTKLEILKIYYQGDEVSNIGGFSNMFKQLTKLKTVYIDLQNCSGITDLAPLENAFSNNLDLEDLTIDFRLSGVEDITKLGGLCNIKFKNLKRIKLNFSEQENKPEPGIKNLDPLTCILEILTLEHITLDFKGCKNSTLENDFTQAKFVKIQTNDSKYDQCIVGNCDTATHCERCVTAATDCSKCLNSRFLQVKASPDVNVCLLQAECSALGIPHTPNASNQFCEPCSDNCQSCTSKDLCTECKANYYKQQNEQGHFICKNTCPAGKWGDNGTKECKDCDKSGSGCVECSTSATTCTKCDGVNFLHNNACSTTCPADSTYYDDATNTCKLDNQCSAGNYIEPIPKKKCLVCHTTCQTCSGGGESKCESCKPDLNFYQAGKQCLVKCPERMYADNNKICKNCEVVGCLDCTKSYPPNCFKCEPAKLVVPTFMEADQCLDACKADQYKKDNQVCVTECGDSYFKDENLKQCTPCTPNCKLCVNTTECQQCKEDYFTTKTKTCVTTCDAGQFGNRYTDKCEDCIENCNECDNPYSCSKCKDGFHLNFGTCLQNCPSGYYSDSKKECQRCNYKCTECAETAEKCTKCADLREVLISNQCLRCDITCLKCSGTKDTECLECKQGMYLQNNECVFICKQGFVKEDVKFTCIPGTVVDPTDNDKDGEDNKPTDNNNNNNNGGDNKNDKKTFSLVQKMSFVLFSVLLLIALI